MTVYSQYYFGGKEGEGTLGMTSGCDDWRGSNAIDRDRACGGQRQERCVISGACHV